MKTITNVMTALVLTSFLFTSCAETQKKDESEKTEPKVVEMEAKKEKLLRHVVIFKFNDDTSEEQVEKLNQSFIELPTHISEIQDFEWGLNNSPEDFHQNFTHCYMLTFKSEEDRDSIYAPHPKHQAFVASLGPYLEKVFVVDYWTNPE
ncbi:Dabb family protein [Flagellimonas sp. 2504JD4-2]